MNLLIEAKGTNSVMPRTNEKNYMKAVKRWLNVILPKLKNYLYNNGGPILAVQIENEYGFYSACDLNYTIALTSIFKQHLGDEIVYFSTGDIEVFNLCHFIRFFIRLSKIFYQIPFTKIKDNPENIKCGVMKNVYPTIDFGPGRNVKKTFARQRSYAPNGPLVKKNIVNFEF